MAALRFSRMSRRSYFLVLAWFLHSKGLTPHWVQCIISAHMDDNPLLPTDISGSPGSVRATLKLRDHGFVPKRDRKKVRPVPSQDTRERAQWIYWLADQCGYDFAVDDPQEIPAEQSFVLWRARHRLKKLKKKT